ncbi:MAG: hypothetical protein ACTSRI_20735 [Promethearchaeota archaeon]
MLCVECGNCGNKWDTTIRRLSKGNWCKMCAFGIYTFDRIKDIVKKAGKERTGKNGILLKPKDSKEFEDFKKKQKKVPSQLHLRVKCGRCGYKWDTTISNIKQSKTKIYSWCINCIKPKYYSFDNIKHKVYDTIIKFIKNEIGVNHYRFDEYLRYLEEKRIDSNIFLKKMVSNQTLEKIIKEAGVNDHSKSQYHIKRCLQVISLAFIKCKNYEALLEELLKRRDIKRNALVKTIVKYITYLGEIYNFNVSHWLPKEKKKIKKIKKNAPYTFSEIESYIKKRGWILLSPKNQNDFNDLKKNFSGSDVPLIVHCGNLEHLEWKSSLRSILNNNSNCPDCSNNVFTYSQIKQIVKNLGIKMLGREGILIQPESNKEFLQIRRDKKTQPSYISLIVFCGVPKHQPWKTNITNLSQEKWCKKCYLERNTKYNFDTIKALVESKGGALIHPTSQEEYEKLLNQLKNKKSKHNSPSDLPIKVSCSKGHKTFRTTPDSLNQNHWCPYCGERYSVVGQLVHPIFEFLFLKYLRLKRCDVDYEYKIISGERKAVDLVIKRNKAFIDNIEQKQIFLNIHRLIKLIIIDFTISNTLNNSIDHCTRGYQSDGRLLIILLLRCKDKEGELKARELKKAIQEDKNIKYKDRIEFLTSDQFLELLNLRYDVIKFNLSKEKITLIKEYKRFLDLIEKSLVSNLELNKLIELSDHYKEKLLKL